MLPEPSKECAEFLRGCVPQGTERFMERCRAYGELLYRINESINLTAIPPEAFWSKHVADSVCILRNFPVLRTPHYMLCDLGCGAGLPSLMLAAACPELQVTAIDSRGKKIDFVLAAAAGMELKNVRALHARANELGHQKEFAHKFHAVTARAVADAGTLRKESVNLLSRSGMLLIYRTPTQAGPEAEELRKQKPAPFFQLTEELELPDAAGRRMFLRIGGTNAK